MVVNFTRYIIPDSFNTTDMNHLPDPVRSFGETKCQNCSFLTMQCYDRRNLNKYLFGEAIASGFANA